MRSPPYFPLSSEVQFNLSWLLNLFTRPSLNLQLSSFCPCVALFTRAIWSRLFLVQFPLESSFSTKYPFPECPRPKLFSYPTSSACAPFIGLRHWPHHCLGTDKKREHNSTFLPISHADCCILRDCSPEPQSQALCSSRLQNVAGRL